MKLKKLNLSGSPPQNIYFGIDMVPLGLTLKNHNCWCFNSSARFADIDSGNNKAEMLRKLRATEWFTGVDEMFIRGMTPQKTKER